MKISIGTKIKKDQAWGGGNNFAINLGTFLQKKGFKVFYDLKCKDLDLIVLTDPRKGSQSSSFDSTDVKNYLINVNSKALVVHRVNECDERKNTKHINQELLNANRVADHTIYISNWLRKLLLKFGFPKSSNSVILNGADKSLFKFTKNTWKQGKIHLVTHHWSNHPNKGARIYQKLDKILNRNYWKRKIKFTYIGNRPQGVEFRNTKIIKPLYGKKLSNALGLNHIYITGSINEPGGNHQNEGAVVGLPLLYVKSGCMNEYCKGFGVSYNYKNLEKKIIEIIKNYKKLKKKIKYYPFNSLKTCDQYYKLFLKLKKNQTKILSKRKKLTLNFKEILKLKLINLKNILV